MTDEERAALGAGTHEPAVDDFGNQYLARRASDAQVALPSVEALAEALWVANNFDPAARYADIKRKEVREFAEQVRAALAAPAPQPATPLDVEPSRELGVNRLMVAIRNVERRNDRAFNWRSGDLDDAAREYACLAERAAPETGR